MDDPYVPSADWADHQRIHQYAGSRMETHGAWSLQIDPDYLDGLTADTAGWADFVTDPEGDAFEIVAARHCT